VQSSHLALSVQNVHIARRVVKRQIAHMEQDMQAADMDGQRTKRLHVLLTEEEMQELDDWMFSQRVRTRGEAVRQMLKIARDTTRAASAQHNPPEKRRKN
jgi:hypothetical protein